jgi:pimeloyl-ACP methyl ester carboxylesterase
MNSGENISRLMDDAKASQQIKLQDGRMLGYADYGSPGGKPVFYFHGFPSSRLDWMLFNDDKSLSDLNVRLIAPDRPGYGLSDYKRGRKMMDWPEDVLELADELQIEDFTVLGISGGGPYAAACAYQIHDRLRKAVIVCGMGPADSPGMKEGVSWTIPGKPSIIRKAILMLTSMGLQRDPDQFLLKSKETMSNLDGQLLDQPELASSFILGMREAFRKGTRGANHDAGLYTRPWGFSLQDISAEVQLWHGERDLNVPLSVGRYVAGTIPNCQATFLEGEGHLTLPFNNLRAILSTLVEGD